MSKLREIFDVIGFEKFPDDLVGLIQGFVPPPPPPPPIDFINVGGDLIETFNFRTSKDGKDQVFSQNPDGVYGWITYV